jgi:DNA-binding response OmpR family regulator
MPILEILVASGADRPPRPAAQGSIFDDGGAARSPYRILVVEDDFLLASELEYWLRAAGFDVIGPAASAEEAFRLARTNQPALAVMDIRLIGPRDGIEAATELYEQLGIRSIFATAHSDAVTLRRGAAANPIDWVHKPYNPATLIARIKRATDGSGGG